MRVTYVETLICVKSFERKRGVNYATFRAVDCKLNANDVTHLGHALGFGGHDGLRSTDARYTVL
jgi:hypothetical protein